MSDSYRKGNKMKSLLLALLLGTASCGNPVEAGMSAYYAATCKPPNVVKCQTEWGFFIVPFPYSNCRCGMVLESSGQFAVPQRLQLLLDGDAEALAVAYALERSLDGKATTRVQRPDGGYVEVGSPMATVEGVRAFLGWTLARRVAFVIESYPTPFPHTSTVRALDAVGLGR